MELLRDFSQTFQLLRVWEALLQVYLVAVWSLPKHPASHALLCLWNPVSSVMRNLQTGSSLWLLPGMLLLSRRSLWEPWQCLLGGWEGHSMGSWRQGTKGFMEHKQHFWMAVHSGEFIWIFCCLKKESRGGEARTRGKGSALIKLTVLLMSLWTQPLSFPLPAAASIIRCRGRRGNVAAHSAAGSI